MNQRSPQMGEPLADTWQSPGAITLADETLANWLLDTGSLTERLQSLCHRLDVEVLFHAEAQPSPSELLLLSAADRPFFVREVILVGDGVPWVFARSIIPQTINSGELLNLGNQPLGKRIFNDPRFERGDFALCKTPLSELSHRLPMLSSTSPAEEVGDENTLYGRRSAFSFANHNLTVAEWFLPQSPAYAQLRGASER